MRKFAIKNVNIVSDGKIFYDRFVLIEDGIIQHIGKTEELMPLSFDIINGKNLYLSAGFIDAHLHGGGGGDFMDGTEEAFQLIAEAHLRHGTTSLLPTTLGTSQEEILNTIKNYNSIRKNNSLLKEMLIGIHLEGPYISPYQAGAQPTKYIRVPELQEYNKIINAGDGNIKRWSVAPELDGMELFAKRAREANISLAIAHSNATYDEVKRAHEKYGFNLVTHLYSAMSTITRVNGFRRGGVLEAAYLLDKLYVEIIADGCHVPPELLKYLVKFKSKDKIILVTDAMRAAATTANKSYLGSKEEGVEVIIEDGVAKLLDSSAFGGSIATMDRLIKTMINHGGVTLPEAINMVTVNPLKSLDLNVNKGKVMYGYDADLVLFDDNINIISVFLKGKRIQ